jgi:hypothetical protein
MANTNNCEQCNTVPSVPVTPPPTCPTSACDEYVSSDCVISTVDGGCTSEFYEYDPNTGALELDGNNNPIPQDPPIQLGLVISENDTLSTVLTNLVDVKNCMFNPDFIAGMLQVIQANPNHPVGQIFCNLVCSCTCDADCQINIVDTLSFNPITDVGFTINWTGYRNYLYKITVIDTNTLPATTYTYTYATSPITGPLVGPIAFSSALLLTSGGTPIGDLPSGHTFQVVIDSIYLGETCSGDVFTISTLQPSTCDDCKDVDLAVTFEPGGTGTIDLVVNVPFPVGYLPQAYNIEIIDPLNNVVFGPADYDPTLYIDSPPANQVKISFGGGTLSGGTYTVNVIPVCLITPSVRCTGDTFTEEILVNGPALCAPPDITNVTITP